MAGGFQQRELSGALFKNDRKEQANHPDYRGDCLIDGEQYWVSGWIKEGAKGKWMSLAFTSKDGGFSKPDKPKPPPSFDDDDIPF
jgi:hypothetical protein